MRQSRPGIREIASAVRPSPGADIPFPTDDLVVAVEPEADEQIRPVVYNNLTLKSFSEALVRRMVLTGCAQRKAVLSSSTHLFAGEFQRVFCAEEAPGASYIMYVVFNTVICMPYSPFFSFFFFFFQGMQSV